MYSDVNLFSAWIDMETVGAELAQTWSLSGLLFQECFLMTATHLIPQIASLVYNASTCLIRFLYVRSSLQVNIQEVYRRNQFTLMFILIGEGINVFNLVSALYYRKIKILTEHSHQ